MRSTPSHTIAIVGGGPAGLAAAEVLSLEGLDVHVYDAMPAVGRKLLLAGRGGLNLTNSEPMGSFLTRYGRRETEIAVWLAVFGPDALRTWAGTLGIETFVGSSGGVFPTQMDSGPLLRSWLRRLGESGVQFHVGHRWLGWGPGNALRFRTGEEELLVCADAVLLALGGGSRPATGSDGAWVPLLSGRGIGVAPLRPANCGFDVGWSEHFRSRFEGQPLKSVALVFFDRDGQRQESRGECLVTRTGLQGPLVYRHSALFRDAIEANGATVVHIDLVPDRPVESVAAAVGCPRATRTLASHLRRGLGLKGVKAGLLREGATDADLSDPERLARRIKAVPVRLVAPRPLAEAISSAGGVLFEELDARLMLRTLPGVFCAGEMIDWEAPTGGYLLTACFASGRVAARGMLDWLRTRC